MKHLKLRPATCLLAVLILWAAPFSTAAEETNSPMELAQALQNKYNALTSLSFVFDQATITGTRKRTGGGDAVFYRYQPANQAGQTARQSVMRWNYTHPDPQIIVSDGETLSIYTEKDKQLIKTPASELESDITYAFFAGGRNLLDDFSPEPPDNSLIFSSGMNLRAILLVPRQPHNQIKNVQVWFDDNDLIRHMKIADHFDSMTELTFDRIEANALPPGDRKALENIIVFTVPPDTEIITH